MGKIEADIALKNWLFGFRPCSGLSVNFQVQYLLQFYQQNLKIITKLFTGFL